MSPRLTCLLTLAGVVLAGVPLLPLTTQPRVPQDEAHPSAAPRQEAVQPVHLTLRFTGRPDTLILRHEGEDIASMPPGTPCPWETDLALPLSSSSVELEVEASWPAPSPENVLTVELAPSGRPSRTETQWSGSDGSLLHSIFTFSWP